MSHHLSAATTFSRFQLLTLNNTFTTQPPFLGFKDSEVPWHLIAIAIFFTLIKLPGPYYPYWVRIIIPHFANGVLLRTLLFAILWYRRPKALKMLGSS
ncbi:hypothetical protein JHK82_054864 [Glycine max]|nr:hypothetical protein JHK82_054864 [Glycine max]